MAKFWFVRTVLALAPAALLVLTAGCGGSRTASLPPVAQDPSTVAVFGGDVLTLAEFEEAYAGTVGGRSAAADDSLGAYQDFLRRYVDFRLKVRAAREAGMDKDSSVLAEIASYRTNLARPYLLENEVLDPIITDLYAKQQEMIDASHIMARVPADAPPEDTLAAYNKIVALVDSLEQGADFGEMAFLYSDDPSARDTRRGVGYRGRLGYFSSGRMVQSFEDRAYATPAGTWSPIFRSEYGYHVLYVHDRREAVQDVQVAHLMIQPRDTTADAKAQARERIDDLKRRIDAGEDFAKLAREHSDDRNSGKQGGDLGFISYYRPLVEPFKETAFSLENVGAVSDVIETPYGYHLIKLLDRKEEQTLDEAYEELKAQAAKMPRARKAEQRLADSILAVHGTSVDTARVLAFFAGTPADSLTFRLLDRSLPPEALATPFATLGDSTYTFAQLASFVQRERIPRQADAQAQAETMVDLFLQDKAIDYAAAQLEETDPYFRRVMQEFRDGLLLFKLMEDSVWTAAARDTAALQALYEANQADYWYPERTRVISFQSPSDSLLKEAHQLLGAGRSVAEVRDLLAQDTLHTVRIDTTLLAGKTESIYDRALELKEGEQTNVFASRGGFYVLRRDGQEPARPKTFEEAQPMLATMYQETLEAQLLERLHAQYNVHVYPERLDQAFATELPAKPPTAASPSSSP